MKKRFWLLIFITFLSLNQGCMMLGMLSGDGPMMGHQHDSEDE